MHVTFDHACSPENFAAHRIAKNVRVQSLTETRSFRELEDAIVINDAGADIAALQWNDPDPPAAPEEMVRSPFTRGDATICIIRETLPPFITVPFLNAAESRPDSVDGVLGVRAKMTKLSRKHRRRSGSSHAPTRVNRAIAEIAGRADPLAVPIAQLEACYFRRTP